MQLPDVSNLPLWWFGILYTVTLIGVGITILAAFQFRYKRASRYPCKHGARLYAVPALQYIPRHGRRNDIYH